MIVATAVEAEDQDPPVIVEVKVDVPFEQIAVFPEMFPAVGTAVTVTLTVAVALAQPPEPAIVYVMIAVPALTPVTAPVVLLMLATKGLPEDQVPPFNEALSCVEPLAQIA